MLHNHTRLSLFLLSVTLLCPATASKAESLLMQGAKSNEALLSATPFQDNNGIKPPKTYRGPTFKLSYDWPTSVSPLKTDAPWQKAIGNKPITIQNAPAYAYALKVAVTENARTLFSHYNQWDARKAGWYNEPWTGSIREAIRGTYSAGEFDNSFFPGTGLRAPFQTHVLTYYDARAAYTMFNLWGKDAMKPVLKTENAQFAEGSLIVKAAVFASTDSKQKTNWWDALKGAQAWDLLIAPDGKPTTPADVWPGYVAQFDIIVKDTQSSPKTGWVFMTLVYDATSPGKDPWERMIPLGVQWGNDPQARAATDKLTENWINPAAPKYSTQTLGWGGRLSGPNDGATNQYVVRNSGGPVVQNGPNSGCISCHSTAQWNIEQGSMVTMLLPSFPGNPPISAAHQPTNTLQCDAKGVPVAQDAKNAYMCSPAPGSEGANGWMKWFQNRYGNVAMDEGSFATDFDEVISFKSLPLWYVATQIKADAKELLKVSSPEMRDVNQYTGAPLTPKQ